MPEIDLATFLTAVYCVVDDLYTASFAARKPRRPGHPPELADSEVLTLAVLAQWQHARSEAAFVQYVRTHWRAYFPRMLTQGAFNRRVRDLAGVLCQLGPAVAPLTAMLLRHSSAFAVLDTVPVPLMRRCRGNAHRLFAAEAQVGRGGSDHDWYYGVQLLVVVNAVGTITGFVFGPANTEERWLAEALLRWRVAPKAGVPRLAELEPLLGPSHKKGGKRQGPTGPILSWLGVGKPQGTPYLADLGFAGRAWNAHWRDAYGAVVLTKADYAGLESAQARRGRRWLGRLRQVIETVNGRLVEVFGLQFPRARSLWGLLARLAAKIAAFNVAVYLNHVFHRPTFSIFDPLTATN